VIDWKDNTRRKTFRLALQRVYPNPEDLRIFVDEELNENLAVIATNNNLQATAHGLVAWAKAKNRLAEVFAAFCSENPDDPVIAELAQRPLVSHSAKLSEEDWNGVFGLFAPGDAPYLQIAFRHAFRAAYDRNFSEIRPDCPSMNNPEEIQELLTNYDNPILAVRFVESVVVELQRAIEDETRDLTAFVQWGDRIAQKHHVPSRSLAKAQRIACQGYLLIAFVLIAFNEKSPDASLVNVYLELWIEGAANPVEFGVSSVTCSFDKVPDHLSGWIDRAKKALDGQNDGEILLELFLPCELLQEDLATTWKMENKRNLLIPLATYQMFVVRSLDRIGDNDVKKALAHNWQLLQDCVKEGNACDRFHLQEKYLETPYALKVLLKSVPGLKLVAQLPPEQDKRRDLFYEIIDAAVPIVLWSQSVDPAMLAELKTQMHYLVRESHLTNFADLARRWQEKFSQSEIESVKHIKLLCDCPDRWPNLPDPDREEDLLVA
jgi:vWA-MoxR associated protein C-terminal domain/Effector-associated domain 1